MGNRKSKKEFIPTVDIEADFNAATKKVAVQLGREIRDAYRDAISAFYHDYPRLRPSEPVRGPWTYERTLSLYDAVEGVDGTRGAYNRGTFAKQLASTSRVRVRWGGASPIINKASVYMAGLYVDPSFIPGEPYQKNPLHGQDFPKADIFNRAFESGIHGFHRGEVRRFNEAGGYWHPKHIPPKMKFPPLKLMDRRYKTISDKQRVRQLLLDALRV